MKLDIEKDIGGMLKCVIGSNIRFGRRLELVVKLKWGILDSLEFKGWLEIRMDMDWCLFNII